MTQEAAGCWCGLPIVDGIMAKQSPETPGEPNSQGKKPGKLRPEGRVTILTSFTNIEGG